MDDKIGDLEQYHGADVDSNTVMHSETQFQAYYPSTSQPPKISNQLTNIRNHPFTRQATEFMKQKNVLYASIVIMLLIGGVVLVFMIPQSTEPIEGTWIKSDGQAFTFDDDNGFNNQIYPGSTYTLEGGSLVMTSTVQIINDGQLVTKLIIQSVDVTFTADENAMWWVWASVTVDDEQQELDETPSSLLIRTTVAKNTYEFGVNSPTYQAEKPLLCQ